MACVKAATRSTARRYGCTKDGEITFIDVTTSWTTALTASRSRSLFNIDNWGARARSGRYECQGVSTNLVTGGCMRGVGDITMGSVVERLAAELAEKIGMDPVEFRIRNQIKPGDPLRQTWAKTLMRHDEEGYRKLVRESAARGAARELAQALPPSRLQRTDPPQARGLGWKDRFVGWANPTTEVEAGRGRGTGIHRW
jgi:CO/xanthine dehydrogenase Mo-binding subunit